MKKTTFAILTTLILTLSGCGTDTSFAVPNTGDSTESAQTQGTAPGILSQFSTTDLAGNPIDQSILNDYNLTMVNVWATFCGPCLGEMPDLGELAAEYEEQGVQVMGIVTDVLNSDGTFSEDQIEIAQDIVSKTNAEYPHLLPSNDLMGLLSQITSVPTTFFVDENGNQVGSAYLGAKSKADWASIIDETLKEVSQ